MSKTYSPCPSCSAINRYDPALKGRPVCARCKTRLRVDGAVSLLDGAGLEALKKSSPLPLVVDFWADWCGPCKMFAPTFLEAAAKMAGELVFGKLDTEAHQPTAAQLGIQSIPTLIVFHRGRQLARFSGAMQLSDLTRWLRESTRSTMSAS